MRRARGGFTLIEIIVVVLIMAVMLGTAVLTVGTGVKSAHLRDAARTVQMYTRHAKAVALLKQRPVVLLFEEISENGEFVKSRISLSFSDDASSGGGVIGSARGGGADGRMRNIYGELVGADAEEAAAGLVAEPASADGGEAKDPLMAEPREFDGIRVHAELREEQQEASRVSMFSNVDNLLKRNSEAKAKAKAKAAEKKGDLSDPEEEKEEDKETSFSVVYEANGRCEPYTVRVYKDGGDEERALVVNIGQFGRTITE